MTRPADDVPSSEVTAEAVYLRRRELIRNAGLFAATSAVWGSGLVWLSGRGEADPPSPPPAPPPTNAPVPSAVVRSTFTLDEELTPYRAATTYNNYYELGTSKSDPARNAGTLRPRPWTVRIEGEVAEPRTVDVDTLLSWFGLEERVYRFRCVETWSMVLPWTGFPLAALVKRFAPTSRAKYLELTTLEDPEQLPGQRDDILPWPYVEALRIDEATNELPLLATGLYGKPLPAQNGAPLRLVVPWKYGFKSIKSIVKLRFTEERPRTTWNRVAPSEYGFYANVNPLVDHPRWSQATERRLGELSRRDTLPYNGYARHVAHLYRGMDLVQNF